MALPSPIHPSFAGRLDDDFVAFYNAHLAIKPETHGLAFDAVRAAPAAHAAPWNRDFSYEPFVNDVRIRAPDGHEFAVRVYAPDARTAPEGAGPYSVYVNFHGARAAAAAAPVPSLARPLTARAPGQAAAGPLARCRATPSCAC